MLRILLSALLFTTLACAQLEKSTTLKSNDGTQASDERARDPLLFATLWSQKSAESQALFIQGYKLAETRLLAALRNHKNKSKKLAVVLDIDETVLDNGPYQADLIVQKQEYPWGWDNWVAAAKAKALPGAKEFLTLAQSKGVEIFYITNRKESGQKATLENMHKLGLPVKESNLLLRTKESSKESRRLQVSRNHDVALLLGDNLDDFADRFEQKTLEERAHALQELRDNFGTKFIVFPNPMYGTWQGAIYNYNPSQSGAQKARVYLDQLVESGEL